MMPPEQDQFKRHIAFKLRIGDILIGKPIMEGERFKFLELGSKNIVSRISIVQSNDKNDNSKDDLYPFHPVTRFR